MQRRAIKIVTNLTGKDYQKRLVELGMTTLEERRERGDLIQAYKVITGKEVVDYKTWFSICSDREGGRDTRSSSGLLNVDRAEGRLEVRKHFWSIRVGEKWNQLPDMVKAAKSTNSFKNGLDNWLVKELKSAATWGGT